jgi:fructokinase
MEQRQLYPLVRGEVQAQLGGYLQVESLQKAIDRFILPPELGSQAGVLGAIALAQQALRS